MLYFVNVNCAFASYHRIFLIFGLTLERWISLYHNYLVQHLVHFNYFVSVAILAYIIWQSSFA